MIMLVEERMRVENRTRRPRESARACTQLIASPVRGERDHRKILTTDKLVVPAYAGTQSLPLA